MGQTKAQLRLEVMRNLGHPFVKVELCETHINDAINKARDMWIKWAVGNATQEIWFTLMLREGQWIYDLPLGVTEVVNYKDFLGRLIGTNIGFSPFKRSFIPINIIFRAIIPFTIYPNCRNSCIY